MNYATLNFFIHLTNSYNSDDNFLASLLVMGALFFAVALVLVIIFTLLFTAIVFGLVAAGIVSSSILVGFHKKSLGAGFKTFFITGSAFLTTVISILFFIITNKIWPWTDTTTAVIAGVILGLLTGWLLGVLIFTSFIKILKYLRIRFTNSEKRALK